MSVSDKWYWEFSNNYQQLKKLRLKNMRNGRRCGKISKNDKLPQSDQDPREWKFRYQREQADNAYKVLPTSAEKLKKEAT